MENNEQVKPKENIFWVKEDTAVVVGMKHPTVDDEADADIRSFESAVEAEQFKKELQALDRENQMFFVPDHRYELFGIARENVEGYGWCLAKVAVPFKARVNRILDAAQKLTQVQPDSVDDMMSIIKNLQSQVAKLSIEQQTAGGDRDSVAQARFESSQDSQLKRDLKDTMINAPESAPETATEQSDDTGQGDVKSPPVAKSKAPAKAGAKKKAA